MLYNHLLKYIVNSLRGSYWKLLKLSKSWAQLWIRVSLRRHFEDPSSSNIDWTCTKSDRLLVVIWLHKNANLQMPPKQKFTVMNTKDIFSESTAGYIRLEDEQKPSPISSQSCTWGRVRVQLLARWGLARFWKPVALTGQPYKATTQVVWVNSVCPFLLVLFWGFVSVTECW